MKDKILAKASELFLNFGFKSVTMDDIAMEMGISKKTIYTHFKNKTKLIESTTISLFDFISNGVGCICELEKNPIEELFAIKEFMLKHLKGKKSSSYFQLQKYYPNIFYSLKMKQLELMQSCIITNLDKGIEMGLFRKDLDLDFTSRIYFNGIIGIKDEETFPPDKFTREYLTHTFLVYHIRSISTGKGIKVLEKLQLKNEK
ncbi:MAG: TetR/AcrR family transcriptional regulator [Flavobacteriaceae bacterium]|nr:TetR/AcrR family transcriptional regulator [Flavobacteriaceae bacterium]